MATDAVVTSFARSHPHTLVLVSEDMDLTKAENTLIEAFPHESLIRLQVDRFARPSVDLPGTDPGMMMRSRGETRHHRTSRCSSGYSVLRKLPKLRGTDPYASSMQWESVMRSARCFVGLWLPARRWTGSNCSTPTGRSTFLLCIETLMQVLQDARFDDVSLPVTFAEGIPARYSRPEERSWPWIEWIREEYRQDIPAKMIEDGLLAVPDTSRSVPFSRLAALLRATPIGIGRERYLKQLKSMGEEEDAVDTAPRNEEAPQGDTSQGDDPEERATLIDVLEALIGLTPEPEPHPGVLLRAAERFLEEAARKANELDNYAAVALLDQIRELARWIGDGSEPLSLDVAELVWPSLPGRVRVGGSGPRPGCIHVDHLLSGGHTSRNVTFIMGLDDGRFPGAGLSDPLLLDHERERISPELPGLPHTRRSNWRDLPDCARGFEGA